MPFKYYIYAIDLSFIGHRFSAKLYEGISRVSNGRIFNAMGAPYCLWCVLLFSSDCPMMIFYLRLTGSIIEIGAKVEGGDNDSTNLSYVRLKNNTLYSKNRLIFV